MTETRALELPPLAVTVTGIVSNGKSVFLATPPAGAVYSQVCTDTGGVALLSMLCTHVQALPGDEGDPCHEVPTGKGKRTTAFSPAFRG